MTYREFFLLNEAKDHLINKLNLTGEQKERLISFFKKYPNLESKIDWNRKDLTFKDFEPLLSNEGKSKSQAKKKGLEGLVGGKDYIIVDQTPDFIAYMPLTYLGSVTLASNRVPPVKENGAKWCIAYQKTRQHWDDYSEQGIKFIFVCTEDTKYALVQYPSELNFKQECYSFEDRKISCPENLKYLYNILLDKVKEEEDKLKKNFEEKYLPSLYEEWERTGVVTEIPKKYKRYVTNIIIPDSVTSIGDWAFDYCTGLTNINIPDSVESIGWCAFRDCKKLTSITIPASVTSIGTGVFDGCESLTSITIPSSVTSIGDHAFYGCESLTSITIPSSVTSIGRCAFRDCKKLTSITIPNSVTSIDDYAFYSCTGLTSIEISNSVTSLRYCVFGDCTNLTNITIPDSVESIGGHAFYCCKNLTINYQGTEEQWKRIKGVNKIVQPIIFNSSKLHESKDHLINKLNITKEQKEKLINFFKKHPTMENKIDWNKKNLSYEDFIELLAAEGKTKAQIKKYGISGKAQIEDLVKGEDYNIVYDDGKNIVYYPLTFKAAEVLAKPTTPPKGITGKWCIAGKNYSPGTRDKYWKSYTADNDVDFFYVFSEDSKIAIARYLDGKIEIFNSEDEKIPQSEVYIKILETVDKYPRELKEKIYYVDKYGTKYSKDGVLISASRILPDVYVIPEGIKEINKEAFYGRQSGKEIKLPSTLEVIKEGAFFYDVGLEKINIPGSCKNIYDGAFSECQSLKEVVMNPGISIIHGWAFCYCPSLEEVNLPDTLTEIHIHAFSDCISLSHIVLPASLKKLQATAFANCQNLWDVKFKGTTEQWQTLVEDQAKFIFSKCPVKTIRCSNGDVEIERT